jgi:hypothetical protein
MTSYAITNIFAYGYYLALQASGGLPKVTETIFVSKDSEIEVCPLCDCIICTHGFTPIKKVRSITDRVKVTRDQTYQEFLA